MNTQLILISSATMGSLGLIFGIIIALAHKKLKVVEDPKINDVYDTLPGANCGGCGVAGCYQYAVAVVEGKIDIDACTAGGQSVIDNIAKVLGVEAKKADKKIATILCQGGFNEAPKRSEYVGFETCKGLDLVQGGNKSCLYGCLGLGDCKDICPFDCISINENGLPVINEETCTGCGKCIKACPRGIIKLTPYDYKVHVYCNSKAPGIIAKNACSVACIGCKLCVKDSPEGAIEVTNNLAIINYSFSDEGCENWVKRCKTKAIKLKS